MSLARVLLLPAVRDKLCMVMLVEIIAFLALAIWLYLLVAHGGFWRARERDGRIAVSPSAWPRVVAVVPARNEAACIAESIGSLLAQDYPGPFRIILVDDDSADRTSAIAAAVAEKRAASDRLTIIEGRALPPGWSGKVWAQSQGVEASEALPQRPDYLLLTDADIVYAPEALRMLVERAEAGGLVLTSLMAKLNRESLAERALVPAFIFFFQMLYPFSRVNQRDSTTAAAAGGCMLVRTDVLRQAGGLARIRNALIDDCTLAKLMKARGPIWLGLSERVRSIRAYPRFDDIRQMVARSAYAQLGYSPLLLAGCVLGMALTYLAPPLLTVFAGGLPRWLGLAAWLMMGLAMQPILRFYRVSPLWGLALPVIAFLYILFTLDSAWASVRGRGGLWKGRVHASPSGAP